MRQSVQASVALGNGTDLQILGPRKNRRALVISNTGAHVVVVSFGQSTASGVTGVAISTATPTIILDANVIGNCIELPVTANSGGGTGSISWIEAWGDE